MTAFSTRGLVAAAFAGSLGLAGLAQAQPLTLQPAAPAAPRQAAPRPIPLPPVRPDGLGTPRAGADEPAVVTAAAEPATPQPVRQQRAAPSSGSISQAEAVQRLNEYFNSFSSLQGDFIQFAADGRRFEGKLYIQRPGRMRFEYRPPVTMEVIADGTSVAIRDKKLATQDIYSIGQTPLKFLVKERMDLARDSTVTRHSVKGDILSVTVEDRSTLGGTSRITLNFDMKANELRQWTVVDPQGYETSVSLYNLDTQSRPNPRNFVIDYQRVL